MPDTRTNDAGARAVVGVVVGVVMGSSSDWPTMRHTAETLDALGVAHETRVVSAHRTPDLLFEYAAGARGRGLSVIIAGAGGAAHLPGMLAANTTLPVLGVPVPTFAIGRGGAVNAALSAAAILALHDDAVRTALDRYRDQQTARVLGNPDPRGGHTPHPGAIETGDA